MNQKDCVAGTEGPNLNITTFGVCSCPTNQTGGSVTLVSEAPRHPDGSFTGAPATGTVVGMPCVPIIIDEWDSPHSETKIGTSKSSSLTTESFLVCAHGGLIRVWRSGQEEVETTIEDGEVPLGSAPTESDKNLAEVANIAAKYGFGKPVESPKGSGLYRMTTSFDDQNRVYNDMITYDKNTGALIVEQTGKATKTKYKGANFLDNKLKQMGYVEKTKLITNWLVGHPAASGIGGRDAELFMKERYEFIEELAKPHSPTASPDWYSIGRYKNFRINDSAYSSTMTNTPVSENDVREFTDGAWVNKENRYWVAVGPGIMNASYNANGVIEASSMRYGSKVDILLEHVTTSEQLWVYCVVGDAKSHTRDGEIDGHPVDGHGVYQTGISYTNKGREYASDNIDASIIEFIGTGRDNSSNMANYKLIRVVVYDDEW